MIERSEVEESELHALLSADADGPALRIDACARARLIDNVLDRAYPAPAPPARRRGRKLAWSLAAAFAITGSAAAMYATQRARESEGRPASDAAAKGRAQATTPALTTAPATTPASTPAIVPPTPKATAATTGPRTRTRVPSASHELAASGEGADDLLKRANRLRGAGDYRAAEDAYQSVVATNPRGAAAYAARVAAAGLRLERLADPRGALRLYADAERTEPNGALSPEIREGMASAYRQLGRTQREQQTLRALLREQPSGPAAERARTRLAVLDARP